MATPISKGKTYVPTEFYLEDVREKLNKLAIGASMRTGHAYKENGSECSYSKGGQGSMMITRYSGGYYFYCFRCNEQGWVDEYRSPKQVIADAKRAAEQADSMAKRQKDSKFAVPWDCMPANNLDVPKAATGWLNRYHIDDELIEKYDIQYSPMYDRIIFPIYEYYIANKRRFNTIIGWCGRCYHPFDKDERAVNHRPKYLTKKDEGHKHDRIFWCMFNQESKHTVVVEDIVSAIRVHEATGLTTLALLTTSFPTNIMSLFQDTVLVWLDNDAQRIGFQHVRKMNQVGTKAYFMSSQLDPKAHDDIDINNKITGRLKSANETTVA